MRTMFAFLVFLTPAACVPMRQDEVQIVDACQHGDAAACRNHPLQDQAVLDANAIMIGMQSSSLREATTQGGAK